MTFHPSSSLDSAPDIERKGNDRLPDLRNTLLWETGLELIPDQSARVSFIAPDRPGRYLILVRGMARDGRILQGRCSFMVD